MKRKSAAFLFSIIVVLSVFACGDKLPVAEMTRARNAITQAESVQAAKYAPDEFGAAKAKLLECHDLAMKEKWDDAKDSAVESNDLAVKAYEKSLPLLAKDTIDSADKSLKGADDAYAEKLAPAEYTKAKTDFETAGKSYDVKEYMQSYKKALDADAEAKSARSIALGKKTMLKESIDEVNHIVKEAEKYNVAEIAPNQYAMAKEHLGAADQAYGNLELKKGYEEVASAKISADEAYLAAAEETAKSRLALAGVAIDKAERSKNPALKEDLAAAKETKDRAKNSLADGNFKQSIQQSDEAIRLATISVSAGGEDKGSAVQTGALGQKVGEEGGESVQDLGEFDTYKVLYRNKAKDCLWRISDKFYGNPLLWRRIFDANRDIIQNPDRIFPGWILKIPKK